MRFKTASIWILVLFTARLATGQQEPLAPTSHPSPIEAIPVLAPKTIESGVRTGLPSGANVAILKIEGLIYGYTLTSLQRRVDQAVQNGASLVVLELDTPGGLVDSALKISKFVKSMPVPTVAWVNPQAYSAGIMIAAACNSIVMAPASATGDCAPIVPGMNLSPTERAKALSPILEDFRDSATTNNYEFVLFHAMCELEISVYQIENSETGQRRLVNQSDYETLTQDKNPNAKKIAPNESDPTVATSSTATSGPVVNKDITLKIAPTWRLVQTINDGTSLLTLNQQRALDVGLARAIVRDHTELKQFLGAATMTTVTDSRLALIAYWLTQPWLRAVLMLVFLVGAYIEFQAPGIGFAGAIAGIALVLLLAAPFLVGLAQIWHIILFLIGLLLVLAEILVIPGFGVAGISGLVCIFVGLVLMVVPTSGGGPMPLPAPEVAQRLRDSILFTLLSIIGSGIAFYYLTKYFGNLPFMNRLVLTNPSTRVDYRPSKQTSLRVSGDEVIGAGQITPGATGRAMTSLRPSGRAEFDDKIVDVVSEGQWVAPGDAVRVITVHGNRIIVEPDTDR